MATVKLERSLGTAPLGLLIALCSLGPMALAADLRVPDEYPDLPAAVAAAADGDRILLAPGTHLVEQSLAVSRRSLEIASADRAQPADLTSARLEFRGGGEHSLRLSHLHFSRAPANTGLGHSIRVLGARSLQVEGCSFEGLTGLSSVDLFEVSGSPEVSLRACRFVGLQGLRSLLKVSGTDSLDVQIEIDRAHFERLSLRGDGLLDLAGPGRCTISDSVFHANFGAADAQACVQAGRDLDLEIVRTRFVRNTAAAVASARANAIRIERSTIAAGPTFAWRAGRDASSAEILVTNSILWGDAPQWPASSSPPVCLRWCCYRDFPVREAFACTTEDPLFCGWGRRTVHVAGAAAVDGDGSRERPFPSIQAALDAWFYGLRSDSPCLRAGETGDAIGAPTPICPALEPTGPLTIELDRGLYAGARLDQIESPISVRGAGVEATTVRGRIGPLTGDASLEHVTLIPFTGEDGGVLCAGRNQRISDCRMSGGMDESISSRSQSLVLTRVEITGDPAIGVGARRGDELRIEACHFQGCWETALISNAARVEISDSVFDGALRFPIGSRVSGRGIVLTRLTADLTIRNSQLRRHRSEQSGAALRMRLQEGHQLHIVGSSFGHNISDNRGAAISVNDSESNRGIVRIENSTFVGNSSRIGGSAVDVNVDTLSMDHSTLYCNPATGGAAISVASWNPSRVLNSILWEDDSLTPWQSPRGNLEFHACCVSGDVRPAGTRNIGEHPNWCDEELPAEVFVDPSAPPGGDGSRDRPFSDIQEASSDLDKLAFDSPLIGAALDGGIIGVPARISLSPCPERRQIVLAAGTADASLFVATRPLQLRGESPETTTLMPLRNPAADVRRLEDLTVRSGGLVLVPALDHSISHVLVLRNVSIEGGVRLLPGARLEAESCSLLAEGFALLDLAEGAVVDLRDCELAYGDENDRGFGWRTAPDSLLRLTRCMVTSHPAVAPPLIRAQVYQRWGSIEIDSCFLMEQLGGSPSSFESARFSQLAGDLSVQSSTWILARHSPAPYFDISRGATAVFKDSILWGFAVNGFFTERSLQSEGVRFERTVMQAVGEPELPPGVRTDDPVFAGEFPAVPRELTPDTFRLRWDSPLIDAASPVDSPAWDVTGTPRDCYEGPDIGCFEFCGPRQAPRPFLRGDVDETGHVTLSDAVRILEGLFRGRGQVGCLLSADVDGDERVELTDAVYLLDWLFLRGRPPRGAFPECEETTAVLAVGCNAAQGC